MYGDSTPSTAMDVAPEGSVDEMTVLLKRSRDTPNARLVSAKSEAFWPRQLIFWLMHRHNTFSPAHRIYLSLSISTFIFGSAFLYFILSYSSAMYPSSPRLNVLVTGYLPFKDLHVNPSGEVALALDGSCVHYKHNRGSPRLRVCFTSYVLPVNATGSTLVANMMELLSNQDLPQSMMQQQELKHELEQSRESRTRTQVKGDNLRFTPTSSDALLEEDDNVQTRSLLGSSSKGLHRRNGPFPYDAVLHLGLESVAKGLKLEVYAVNYLADNIPGTVEGACVGESYSDQPIGAAAVPNAACQLPTTADLGRTSLQEALLFSLDPQCQVNSRNIRQCVAADLDAAHTRSSSSPEAVTTLLGTPPHIKVRIKRHVEEEWSRDAGTYFCNEMYYRTLHAVRRLHLRTVSGSLLPVLFTHMPTYEILTQEEMVKLVQHIGAQLAAAGHRG